jgi:MYXO-CTERM domain-containing protein
LSEATDSDGDGISDADEGAGDSDADGIPDYVDNINVVYVANTLASSAGVVQSEPGTTLMLGGIALGLGKNNVMVTESEIAALTDVGDTSYDYPEALIDFAVTGAEFGHSYTLVVPLSVVLPEGAVYRKYSTLGGWANFVENATNALSSAMTVEGVCPELGSDAYTLGLTAGDDCLQLLMEDGGPNDADGAVNGTLVDPGGIAIKYIGTPSDSSEITLSSAQLTANGSASATVTVTVLDAQGVGLEHMSVSASVAISGAGVGTFVEQGSGVYTATLTAGNTAGSAAVVAVIDNGEVSVTVSSDPITLNAVAVVTPSSNGGGGGGCTVATDGSADASLLLLLMMAGLLLARRRYQLR